MCPPCAPTSLHPWEASSEGPPRARRDLVRGLALPREADHQGDPGVTSRHNNSLQAEQSLRLCKREFHGTPHHGRRLPLRSARSGAPAVSAHGEGSQRRRERSERAIQRIIERRERRFSAADPRPPWTGRFGRSAAASACPQRASQCRHVGRVCPLLEFQSHSVDHQSPSPVHGAVCDAHGQQPRLGLPLPFFANSPHPSSHPTLADTMPSRCLRLRAAVFHLRCSRLIIFIAPRPSWTTAGV